MFKLLCFAGSTRQNSFNVALARGAFEYASRQHHGQLQVQLLDLAYLPIPIYQADDESEYGLPKNVQTFKAALAACDALLIVSPEYNGFFSPLLKNALDWASRKSGDENRAGQVFVDKPCLLLSASPSINGGQRGLASLAQLLQNLGAKPLSLQLLSAKTGSSEHAVYLFDSQTAEKQLQTSIESALNEQFAALLTALNSPNP